MTTLRQLEYLVTVVDEGSFTRAAERLYVTQPALSHQIRALETSVGGALLERLPRSVRPTPMGRALLPYARAALADATQAVIAARQAVGLQCGEVQLATVHSVSLGPLPRALSAWRRKHPHVLVRLHEHAHTDLLEDFMAAGKADLAVGPMPRAWNGEVTDLGEEEFVVLLPPGDEARCHIHDGRLALQTLNDRSWVHYGTSNGLSRILDAACAAVGYTPRAALRTEQTAALPRYVAAGLGPALVPANIVPQDFPGTAVRPAEPITRRLFAYTRHRPDPVAQALIEALHQHLCVLPDHLRDVVH